MSGFKHTLNSITCTVSPNPQKECKKSARCDSNKHPCCGKFLEDQEEHDLHIRWKLAEWQSIILNLQGYNRANVETFYTETARTNAGAVQTASLLWQVFGTSRST